MIENSSPEHTGRGARMAPDALVSDDKKYPALRRRIISLVMVREVEDPRNKVVPSAAEDIINRAFGVWTVNDDGSVVPRVGGEILFGPDGRNPVTPGEWVQSLRSQCPHLFLQAGPAEDLNMGDLSRLGALDRLHLANDRLNRRLQ